MKRLDLIPLLTRSSALMAARVAGAAIAFAGTIVIARQFGADTLGQIALCLAAMALLSQLVGAGWSAVAPLFVSEYIERKQPERIRGFVRGGRRLIAALSLMAFAALGGGAILFADALGPQLSAALLFASLSALPVALVNFHGGVLTGYRRQLLGIVPDLLVKPSLVFLAIVAVAALTPADAAPWLLGGMCLAFWATAGIQAYMVHRQALLPKDVPADDGDASLWRAKATPWIAIILLADYIVELHLLLAGWLLAPALVGILHICFRLRMLASFGMRALYAMVLPDVYAAHARGDSLALAQDITRGNALVLVYVVSVCAAFALVGEWLLDLFGDGFADGYDALLIIALSMIPRAVFGPATAIMAAAGRQKPMILILIAGMALSGATIHQTFDMLGFLSIAVGYTAAITAVAIAQWWWTLRETGIDCSVFALWTHRRRAEDGFAAAGGQSGTALE